MWGRAFRLTPNTLRVLGGAVVGSSFLAMHQQQRQHPYLFMDGLPVYKMKEVNQHTTIESRVWVTYKDGVYDVTDFIPTHPGGDKIMLAAGGAVDPFWRLYAQHQTEEVQKIFSNYKIGTLDASEVVQVDPSDPFSGDPERHPALKIHNRKPFNAETPAELINDSMITPNDLFFVRNHLPVPQVDIETYRLVVQNGDKTIELSFEDLKKLPQFEVTTTIQCAGNRRSGLEPIKAVAGLKWNVGAASTAVWRGPRLRDVLLAVGVDPTETAHLHLHLEGLDRGPDGVQYGSSIPLKKAMGYETVLALEMNGTEIPRDHGYPVRVIVPGTVGARNVKWIAKIAVASDESPSFWQRKDYRLMPPNLHSNETLDDSHLGPAIQETPVQSMITSPRPGQALEDEEALVQGYATAGGGRGVARVEVSVDGGKTWQVADRSSLGQPTGEEWAWTFFKKQVPLKLGDNQLCVRAVDSAYNSQPQHEQHIWNPRGLLNNSYHCIQVHRKPAADEE